MEMEQILLPEKASSLAVQALLRMNTLKYDVVERPNAEEMSPSGNL